jgi:hypothetical protein
MQSFQKTDGKLAEFILPSTSSKDEIYMANQSYLEMYNVAESKVQYIDGQLQHAPMYLKHDE